MTKSPRFGRNKLKSNQFVLFKYFAFKLLQQYYSCMMLKMGFMEQDGAINGPEIIEFMAPQYDRDAVTTVVDSCKNPEGKLIQDKAYAFAQCFFAKKSFEI